MSLFIPLPNLLILPVQPLHFSLSDSRLSRCSGNCFCHLTMYRLERSVRSGVSANPKEPTAELALKTEKNAEETSLHCSGRINSATSDLLQKTIRALIPKTRHIVLDLSGVSYIDSSGLGAIVSIYLAVSRAGGELKVSNAQPRIRDLFQVTKLAAVFENDGYRRLNYE